METPRVRWEGSKIPHPAWQETEYWRKPVPEFPMLDAAIWVHRETGDTSLVVLGDLGIVHWFPSAHPSTWNITWKEAEVLVMKFVKRAVERSQRAAEARSAAAVNWEATHPAVWEYMTCEAYEDGAPRQPSMLCVFLEDGVVKACLQDRQEGRSLWISAPSLLQAFDALEAKLQAGTDDWRVSRAAQAKSYGPRKK